MESSAVPAGEDTPFMTLHAIARMAPYPIARRSQGRTTRWSHALDRTPCKSPPAAECKRGSRWMPRTEVESIIMWQLFMSHRGRSIHKWPQLLPDLRAAPRALRRPLADVYEIGVSEGGSLQLWKKYFGPNATIVGIDIEPACATMEEPQISVRIGDQRSRVPCRGRLRIRAPGYRDR